MDSKIISAKKLINKHGDLLLDLTTKSIDYQSVGNVIDAFMVGEDREMRADLISTKAYGTDDEYDIILKYNGISNPFSIDKEEIIFVPDLSYMYSSLATPSEGEDSPESNVRNQYLDDKKDSTIDTKKVEYDQMIKKLQKNTSINISQYNLPPNLASPGDSEVTVKNNGDIVFGDNVTKNS